MENQEPHPELNPLAIPPPMGLSSLYVPVGCLLDPTVIDFKTKYLSQTLDLQLVIENLRKAHQATGEQQMLYLDSPTGGGKTRATCMIKPSIILLVPMRDQAKQIAAMCEADPELLPMQPVYGRSGSDPASPPVVYLSGQRHVCVIDSFPKLLAAYDEAGIDISDVPIMLDEAHLPAQAGYRLQTLIKLKFHLSRFHIVMGMSASGFSLGSIPLFEGAQTIKLVRPEIKTPINLEILQCESYLAVVWEQLKLGYRIILHMNDIKKSEALKELLEHIKDLHDIIEGREKDKPLKVKLFNSTTTKEKHHKDMVERGIFPDCDILIVTEIYNTGFSFFYPTTKPETKDTGLSIVEEQEKHRPYVIIITRTSGLGPEDVGQVLARVRNERPETVIIASTGDYDEDYEYGGYDKEGKGGSHQTELEAINLSLMHLCEMMNYQLNLYQYRTGGRLVQVGEGDNIRWEWQGGKVMEEGTAEHKLYRRTTSYLKKLGAIRGIRFDEEQGKYIVIRMEVHQMAYDARCGACNNIPELMASILEEHYNMKWVNSDEGYLPDEYEEQDEKVRESKKKIKEVSANKVREAVQKFETYEEIEELTQLDDFGFVAHREPEDFEAARILTEFKKARITIDSAKAIVASEMETSITEDKVKKVLNQIGVITIVREARQMTRVVPYNTMALIHLAENVKTGDYMTDEYLERVFAIPMGICPEINAFVNVKKPTIRRKRMIRFIRDFKRLSKNKKSTGEIDEVKSAKKGKEVYKKAFCVIGEHPLGEIVEFDGVPEIVDLTIDSDDGIVRIVRIEPKPPVAREQAPIPTDEELMIRATGQDIQVAFDFDSVENEPPPPAPYPADGWEGSPDEDWGISHLPPLL